MSCQPLANEATNRRLGCQALTDVRNRLLNFTCALFGLNESTDVLTQLLKKELLVIREIAGTVRPVPGQMTRTPNLFCCHQGRNPLLNLAIPDEVSKAKRIGLEVIARIFGRIVCAPEGKFASMTRT